MTDRLTIVFAKFFGLDPERIDDQSSPETVEGWDSLEHLLLLGQVEREFKIKFSVEDILSVRNFKDIRELLGKHGVTT